MTIRLEHVDDQTIRLHHERVETYMEVWTRAGVGTVANTEGVWFWNLHNGRIRGSDTNMFVAIEKAMTELTHMVEGNPNDG